MQRIRDVRAVVGRVAVIPVVTLDEPDFAEALAHVLVEAGLPAIEITLRTPRALDAIERVARNVGGAVPIAGTVVAPAQIAEAVAAGARALVTPGTPRVLADALVAAGVPALPGCATVSEAMALADLGFPVLKFFPAAASGGASWLKAVAGPLPGLAFCPTGGIDAANAGTYLSLANVAFVGGTWIAPQATTLADLPGVRERAAAAAALRQVQKSP